MAQSIGQSVNLGGKVLRLLRGNLLYATEYSRMLSVHFEDMRIKYKDKSETFTESHLVSKEPIGQFTEWFTQARTTPGILEPNAMCLSTANKNGIPSARFVLLKSYGKDGFKFFTYYDSRKGKELEENPNAALTFYWESLNRQVRVEGRVEKLGDSEAVTYFESRPYPSQVGSAASNQSQPISSRDVLIQRSAEIMEAHKGKQNITKPPNWGGFLVVPSRVEFWQGQSDRLHDRIVFRKGSVEDSTLQHPGDDGWIYERLSP